MNRREWHHQNRMPETHLDPTPIEIPAGHARPASVSKMIQEQIAINIAARSVYPQSPQEILQELQDLDDDEGVDPPWTTQYTVQDVPEMDYEPGGIDPPPEGAPPDQGSAGDQPTPPIVQQEAGTAD